ncbi:ER-derived vesicles protein ERV29 [Lachancea thermotolerans]|uniref:KLTH0B09592p n=1 Tax=Lachancea thermotolerans (strain ATCC 56472 / CBS 6340 / NRRL Y-8284) TaxID=559295 RepID=C5DDA5_LACTC|nr:KLTH0B09592p [Lachancea thermotolerans CBS 6340]CAR21766.1 KLTH0B09592p [Lachancea thermotolerans CBS 6340]
MSFRGNSGFSGIPTTHQGYKQNPYTASAAGKSSSLKKTVMDELDKLSNKVDDLTDHPVVQKLKPYTPAISRFFIVATFYEDSFRIISQWSDQVFFLWNYRHLPYFFVVLFLLAVVLSMTVGATMLILRKRTIVATGVLCACIVLQGLVYGLYGGSFVLRNVSVIGGLLIAFSDSIVQSKTTFGMLPELHNKDGKTKGFLLLMGRLLLVVLFVTFTFTKNWLTVLLVIIGTICISVGFKTKLASILLGLILAFYNITVNNYWFYDSGKRDLLKYEYFQNLSIIGGLLLVVSTGAGELSIDEKKKIY